MGSLDVTAALTDTRLPDGSPFRPLGTRGASPVRCLSHSDYEHESDAVVASGRGARRGGRYPSESRGRASGLLRATVFKGYTPVLAARFMWRTSTIGGEAAAYAIAWVGHRGRWRHDSGRSPDCPLQLAVLFRCGGRRRRSRRLPPGRLPLHSAARVALYGDHRIVRRCSSVLWIVGSLASCTTDRT